MPIGPLDQPEDPCPAESGAPIDPIAALSHIEDGDSDRREAQRWAEEAMIAGRQPDDLISQLTSHGWSVDTAGEIVEQARQQTRRQRGIVTRDDVVRDLNATHRHATAGLSVAFRSGLFGLYGWTTTLMAALRALRKLKQKPRKNRADSG